MNILNNFYTPIYHYIINNTSQNNYNNLILYEEKNPQCEILKLNEINKLCKKYLYIQNNIEYVDITNQYSIIIKSITEKYGLVSINNDSNIYKVILNKNYEYLYKNRNLFHEPFETYIPNKDEIFIIYKRNIFTKKDLLKILENNIQLYNDFNKNNIKDIKLLLQLYVPQLPKQINYNKYNINEFMNYVYKRSYNEIQLKNGSLTNFFKQIQKVSEFTIFGGISLKYFYHKYKKNIDVEDIHFKNIIKNNILESNDYDLNITYLKKNDLTDTYDNITFCNYIIFMLYYINLSYYKKIIDKNIQLNVLNETSPYINMYMTFSSKEDMNIYIWFLSHHTHFELKMYYSNILYAKDDETPYIYKAQFINKELHSILTLKYTENNIIDVKSIMKLEVHNNQTEPLDIRVNKNYSLIDFIFKNDINTKFSVYDKDDNVHYNNPVFLSLVYIDLIQKYQRNCISVTYRKQLGKEEKDKMRYIFIIKDILIPYFLEQNDKILNKMFEYIQKYDSIKYKNILVEELLKFKCKKNIYNQMDEYNEFLINKVEQIVYKYFNNEDYRYIKLNDYNYDIVTYNKMKLKKVLNKKYIINNKEDIGDIGYIGNIDYEIVYKINDFLRILYDEKKIEYNTINIYNERLDRKLLSLENVINKELCELSYKIEKLMKLHTNFEKMKNDYKEIYEKMTKIKYKSKLGYQHLDIVIEKITFINDKIKYIEESVEISNKDLIFKERLEQILRKQFKKYKEEEKRIKIANKVEIRRLEAITYREERKAEEQLRLEKEEQLRKEIDKKELIIKEDTKSTRKEGREKIQPDWNSLISTGHQKYKEKFLYIPCKLSSFGLNVKNRSVIYIHNISYYINWIYRNISFMIILKVFGLFAIIGILCYGKYLHYMDEQKHLEMVREHESKIKYNQRYDYRNYNSNKQYKFNYQNNKYENNKKY